MLEHRPENWNEYEHRWCVLMRAPELHAAYRDEWIIIDIVSWSRVTAESKCHMSQHATNVLQFTRDHTFRFARFNGESTGNHDYCFFDVCTIGLMEQSNKDMAGLRGITMDFQKLRDFSEYCTASHRPTAVHDFGSIFCVVHHPMEWHKAQCIRQSENKCKLHMRHGCRPRYFHFSLVSIRFNIQWKRENLCTQCCFHDQICILFPHSPRTWKTGFAFVRIGELICTQKKYRWHGLLIHSLAVDSAEMNNSWTIEWIGLDRLTGW